MKIWFPLYAKILGWFFLNLAVFVVAAGIFLRWNFNLGFDQTLLGYSGGRVQTLTNLIVSDLRAHPPGDWNGVLERYARAYGFELRLFRNDGPYLAGANASLPENVRRKLTERPWQNPGAPQPGNFPDGRPPGPIDPKMPMRFLLRTTDAPHFWLLVRDMIENPEEGRMPVTLLFASDSIGFHGLLVDFRPWLAAAGGALLFSVLFWLPFVRGITRSISKMTRATGQIADGHFDVRVPAARRDELGSLAQSVNTMAARLDGLVSGQKRFLGDIAHELCSPIARMQLALGILEQRAEAMPDDCVADLREEIEEMSALVNELLSFSKASLGAQVTLQNVPLLPLVEKAIARETLNGAQIDIAVAENLRVRAEPELLQRSIANLVRNALRYAGHTGPVALTAEQSGGEISLTVADHGPGIPADAIAQIFDPFYRVDPSRVRETGGAGLGLAIVKTCVESCGGSVTARNRDPHGLEVVVALRAAAGVDAASVA